MKWKSIRWRLPASYAVIALLAALSLGSMMMLVLRSYYSDQEYTYLLGNAIALQPVLEQVLQSEVPEDVLQDQITALAFLSQAQIRVMDSNEHVIADSGEPDSRQTIAVAGGAKWKVPFFGSGPADPPDAEMPIVIYSKTGDVTPEVLPFNQEIPFSGPAPQPDVILAVRASPYGYTFVSSTQSDPTRRSSQVVNVPLTASNGRRLGELEFSNGPSYGADVITSVTMAWIIASVFAVVIAAFVGWFISKRVTHPVLVLENATRQMEQGNLSVRVSLPKERQQEFLSLANSFNGMAEQVEQTVSTLREFVADAAHELHTPLTALQANIELARDEKDASERTRYLARAQEQGQRLEGLVKSLLDLSRIEAAESKAEFGPVDIIQLVKEVSEQFASRAEQAEREFKVSITDMPIVVNGNEHQLKQVLTNLLDNALKFTPKDGSISLRVEQFLNEVQLSVTDTGIGIPADDLAHLFERFHRARNASGFAGNGLGLAIAKAIVAAHGGRITAESQSMSGTVLKFSIPILK